MKNEEFIKLLPLETDNLIIRKVSTKDVNLMLKMDKQESTQKYLGGIKTKTYEERLEFLNKKEEKFNEGHASQLTVCLKDGTGIGFTSLSISEKNNNAEVSYMFDSDYTGKGYCSESLRELLRVAFEILDLHKVYADTVEGNLPSKKVLEKNNFKLEGIRREAAYDSITNTYKDFYDYGLLKDEYKKN